MVIKLPRVYLQYSSLMAFNKIYWSCSLNKSPVPSVCSWDDIDLLYKLLYMTEREQCNLSIYWVLSTIQNLWLEFLQAWKGFTGDGIWTKQYSNFRNENMQ